ncbi:MAG: cation transporter [Deltaproteobacteria bacterium]|jgi:copper chaperone CopZ|nr:cation transporter [Deltaproteobacteria bacterium]
MNKIFNRRYLFLGFLVGIIGVMTWLFSGPAPSQANLALAEFQVQQLTCGSCVSKIENALHDLDGVNSVDVNITRNLSKVAYDPSKTNSQAIARAITTAGYPAFVLTELSAEEYASVRTQESQLGDKYVARIGERLISRANFEQRVNQYPASDSSNPGRANQLWQKAWQDLLQRELLLTAAENNNVVVQAGEVELRLNGLRQRHSGFEALIKQRYGSMDAFSEQLREDMVISRNLEEHVFQGAEKPGLRKLQFQNWYAGLLKQADVVIFEPRLKEPAQSSGGCACCS